MRNLLYLYRYRLAYLVSLVIAIYIAINLLPASSSFTEGFIKFLVAAAFMFLGIYFRTKDMANKP